MYFSIQVLVLSPYLFLIPHIHLALQALGTAYATVTTWEGPNRFSKFASERKKDVAYLR